MYVGDSGGRDSVGAFVGLPAPRTPLTSPGTTPGAASATFVEHDSRAANVIASNLSRAGLAGPNAAVVRDDALRWLRRADAPRFDVVIVDPPYDRTSLLVQALEALSPLAAPGGRVVAKHFWRDTPPAKLGLLASERDRRFGETTLTFYRRQEDR